MAKLTHVSVGVVFNTQGEILVALRPSNKLQGGLWEFPGGKIEGNETAEEALKRELFEEVDIVVTSSKPLLTCQHSYQHRTVHLAAFEVREFTGTAYGKEGQLINWVMPQALLQLPLLSANHPIVLAVNS